MVKKVVHNFNWNWQKNRTEFIAMILACLMIFSTQEDRFNLTIYDGILSNLNQPQENHTVIIDIDDKSLTYLGEWPWSRNTHGTLLEQLNKYQVAAVGIDILFPAKPRFKINEDIPFAEAIKRSGNVVLPISPTKNAMGNVPELLPQSNLAQNAAGLGHVDFELDVDGIVRKTFLYAGYQSSQWPAFGLLLAQIANPELQIDESELTYGDNWVRRDTVNVNFYIPDGNDRLPHVSYVDVLNGNVDASLLRGKVVLIGMNATAMGDQFATPVTNNHQTMAGVEVNAHLVNNLLNESTIKRMPQGNFMLLTTIMAIITLILLTVGKSDRLLSILILNLVLSMVVCYFLLINHHTWYPPVLLLSIQLFIYTCLSLLRTQLLAEQVSSLSHSLYHDEITALANENAFVKHLDQACAEKLQFTVLWLELSKFRGVGELLGQQTRMALLLEIKQRINNIVDKETFVARGFGANFLFALSKSDGTKVQSITEKLIAELSQSYQIGSEHLKLPVHIGACRAPDDGNSGVDIIAAAESALHRAKEQQEHFICFYDKDIKDKLIARAKLESDLSHAIEKGEIEVHYQPQVSSFSGAIIGAEALARWRHPERGLVSPEVFIPVAETTGLIIEIGTWILNQACQKAKYWQEHGHKDFRIAVNMSSKQFVHPNLIPTVLDALDKSGLEPSSLELELTESCVVDDIDQAVATLDKLKELGIALSIDDFGTGYSSLSYLKHFPMDRLKIDKSFIDEIQDNEESQNLTKAIISMAHSLNLKVIAEGIETHEQKNFLNEHACEEMQGYLFGRPITSDNMEQLLNSQKEMTIEN